ncbi:MAG TPA: hypothetical protein VGF44_16975 [Terriglobales bacterium]|jgi:hypothetical protein
MRFHALTFTSILALALVLTGCSKASSPNASSDSSSPASTDTAQNGSSASSSSISNDNTAQAQPIIVPTGTSLAVRLDDAVGSKISKPGQSFSGTLAQTVQVKGQTAFHKGARVSGTVVDAQPLGRFKGGARLELKLTSVGGHKVQTASFVTIAKGKGKRTAVMAGGGAGLGAAMGGIFGGGKGALIGAAAGGGAGTAGAAYTGNKEIEFPVESALTFKLSKSLQL